MTNLGFANNSYGLPHHLTVPLYDRGHTLGDGVYEYIAIWHQRLIDLEPHLDRLYRSLAEVRITNVISRAALRLKIIDLCRQNHVVNGGVYLQITRGTAKRDHYFPDGVKANLSIVIRGYPINQTELEKGVSITTAPDFRWDRCDIKTISLIANCLAKQQARDLGAGEVAFYLPNGKVTEGGSSNLWLINRQGQLITHIADHNILNGITKQMISEVAKELGLILTFDGFMLNDIEQAKEMFLTSTSRIAVPVVKVDDKVIGNGQRGEITEKLQQAAHKAMMAQPQYT